MVVVLARTEHVTPIEVGPLRYERHLIRQATQAAVGSVYKRPQHHHFWSRVVPVRTGESKSHEQKPQEPPPHLWSRVVPATRAE